MVSWQDRLVFLSSTIHGTVVLQRLIPLNLLSTAVPSNAEPSRPVDTDSPIYQLLLFLSTHRSKADYRMITARKPCLAGFCSPPLGSFALAKQQNYLDRDEIL